MHEVVFHRLASRELRAASQWYRARSERACQRFRQAVLNAVDRIAANPHAHATLADPYRCARVCRFPYLLIFETRPNGTVFVVAVAHTSRRPGYWRRQS
jgi:plasmid stabilization system protein ParE